MAAQRRSGRFMSLAAITIPLVAAGVVWAGPVQADPISYLNDLHNAGIQDFAGGDAALLQTGQRLCQQLSYGVPPAQLQALALQKSDTDLGPNGLNPAQADLLVYWAQRDLCPSA
ncbi:DUF732 domain-containing protein [Mycobacterium sp. E796]|uniref:DUF732 domain-containing protein n=1 Tax=Mycobacterium sp. E796 TaxID=1834151 RepID=UPI0007FDA94D|nr:DUF732 domain-containing protein [Mycobacterium sp. E796]OBI60141.1 hypothetical protein A5706_17710 [Mycobacterium sp. E796]